MTKLHSLKPLAAALLVVLGTTGQALANDGIQEEVTVTPGRQITPQDEAAISGSAVKVLRHIADARGELRKEKPDAEAAKVQLEQAEKLLDIIKAALPTTKVKDHVWVATKHLEYEDTREVLPDLVPIYASLDELVDYIPTAKAKTHLDQAKQALEEGDKPKAAEQLQEVDDALLYVEADLPLGATRHLVGTAREELNKGDTKAADATLAAAEDNVVFVSLAINSPLTQAKASLWRAVRNTKLGEKDLAKADLDEAVNYLEKAAKSADEVTREAAAAMVTQVRDVHDAMSSDDEGAASKLESLWYRVQALSERSAEYISTGWQRWRADGAGKSELIEAKLQLAYARIDHVYSKDDAAAKIDLAEAKGYLDAAAKVAPAQVQDDVKDVSHLVADLETALEQGDSAHDDRVAFEDAEARLGSLVQKL